MLTRRQLNILEDLSQVQNVYLTSKTLAQKYSISIRTVQNELSVIRDEVNHLEFMSFVSVPSKGSSVTIMDADKFRRFINDKINSFQETDLNTRNERINRIIAILVNSKTPISIQHLADRLFISRTTLFNDLKQVLPVLEKYHINYENKIGKGLYIVGDELDIRKMINKEKIDFLYVYSAIMEGGYVSETISKIRDIVVTILTQSRYRISDVALQNLIVHIDIIIRRMKEGFRLENIFVDNFDEEFKKEKEIASKIFEKCRVYFRTDIIGSEVMRLAIYLHGKSDYSDDSYITQEIDEFVLASLRVIRDNYGVDFVDNVQLRIALSLHLVPLITRLKYGMQLKNELLHEIRRSFPVAFDIASAFAYRIQEDFSYGLREDEIAYFAIYFNNALNTYHDNSGSSSVLIVSAMKRSETLLLRERVNSWFTNQISKLEILSIYDLPDDLAAYDVILTTEKNKLYDIGTALLISQFPGEEDYRIIKMAIDGFQGKQDVLNIFNEALFFSGHVEGKEEIIIKLCHLIDPHNLSDNIRDEVMKRELMGGTYFGNSVAMPHPMHPVTSKSHIAVALLENDVLWDEVNTVRIVLLVCIEKDNPKAYNVWSYLSTFITDNAFAERILKTLTFENFIHCFSDKIDELNWELREY